MKEIPPPNQLEENQSPKVLNMHEFEKESIDKNIIFALVTREVVELKEENKEYPAQVK